MRSLEWHEATKSLIDHGEGGMVLDGVSVDKVKRSINVMRVSELASVADSWGLERDGKEKKGISGCSDGSRRHVFRIKRK